MNIHESITALKADCTKVINKLKESMNGINLGQANVSLLQNIVIKTSYGTSSLNHIANVNVKDIKTLSITPFNPSDQKAIIQELQKKNLGSVINSKHNIFLTIPPLTLDLINAEKKKLSTNSLQYKDQLRSIRQNWKRTYQGQKEEVGKDLYKNIEKKMEETIKKTQDLMISEVKSFEKKIDALFNNK